MPDVVPPVHDDPVTDNAPVTPADHKASCVICQVGGECDELAAVVYAWRQSLRHASANRGSAGGWMTAEEPAR